MPINSVAGTPTTRGGGLARAARMWWTPEQGGLRPEFRQTEEASGTRQIIEDLQARITKLEAWRKT